MGLPGLVLLLAASATVAPPPITVDLQKAPVGSWAAYTMQVGNTHVRARWAFLRRDPGGNTLELATEGTAGGTVVTRMVLVPDPIGATKPIKELVVQLGGREPVEIPLDLPGLPAQKFQNPDPKKLVGRERITVAAGTFAVSHYHDVVDDSTVDSWVTDEVPPLGVVRIVSTPRPGAVGPGGRPLPPVTMELGAHGKDARPAITRAARPLR